MSGRSFVCTSRMDVVCRLPMDERSGILVMARFVDTFTRMANLRCAKDRRATVIFSVLSNKAWGRKNSNMLMTTGGDFEVDLSDSVANLENPQPDIFRIAKERKLLGEIEAAVTAGDLKLRTATVIC